VIQFEHPGWWPRKVDIVFAIDDSPALAPYLDRMRTLPAALVGALKRPLTGIPDLRFGVVTPATGLTGVLDDVQNVDGTRTTSFEGTLLDAVAARLDVGATSSASPRLLDAMQHALEEPAFLRPRGDLLVVTISARDDESPSEPGEYALFVRSAKSTQWNTRAITIHAVGAAPRLDAFQRGAGADAFSIDATDYSTAFNGIASYLPWTYGAPCIDEPADTDPDKAGAQYDCAMVMTDEDQTEHVLAACTPTSAGPCWELTADPLRCASQMLVAVRGYVEPFRPGVRGQCVAN
jgi:hypothetical protein